MNDNDIIKAIKNCVYTDHKDGKCTMCEHVTGCKPLLLREAYDLINRQKAEIEKLQMENKKQKVIMEEMTDLMFPLPFETDYDKAIQTAKAKAIKEFAEKLKRDITINNTEDGYLIYSIDYGCLMEDIDNLVKEITEDNNA